MHTTEHTIQYVSWKLGDCSNIYMEHTFNKLLLYVDYDRFNKYC